MNRREFLRNMLYGAGVAVMPSLALGESVSVPALTFEFWSQTPHGSFVHLALVQHGDGRQTRYMNGREVEPGSYREMILREWFPEVKEGGAVNYPFIPAEYDVALSGEDVLGHYAAGSRTNHLVMAQFENGDG